MAGGLGVLSAMASLGQVDRLEQRHQRLHEPSDGLAGGAGSAGLVGKRLKLQSQCGELQPRPRCLDEMLGDGRRGEPAQGLPLSADSAGHLLFQHGDGHPGEAAATMRPCPLHPGGRDGKTLMFSAWLNTARQSLPMLKPPNGLGGNHIPLLDPAPTIERSHIISLRERTDSLQWTTELVPSREAARFPKAALPPFKCACGPHMSFPE